MDVIPDAIGVGFGTAALGSAGFETVQIALENGFRAFDTAEAEYWYDQQQVGEALQDYFSPFHTTEDDHDDHYYDDDDDHDNYSNQPQDCDLNGDPNSCIETNICQREKLKISTKIPPWELLSIDHIRRRGHDSREQLLGWCPQSSDKDEVFPLDVYYIHAPKCWNGWHARCNGVTDKDTLPLRQAWMGMEAVAHDGNARRIGLSNISPHELLDIIRFVKEREREYEERGDGRHDFIQPRMPDVLQAYSDPLQPSNDLRQICKEHGIEFVSYSTLGTQHVMRNRGQNPVLGNREVIQLAELHQRSTAEVVLSWALQRGMSVIPRSTKRHHIEELANLLTEAPFLEPEHLAIMDGLALN